MFWFLCGGQCFARVEVSLFALSSDNISSFRSIWPMFAYQSDRFVGDLTGGAVVGSIGEVYSADTARLY